MTAGDFYIPGSFGSEIACGFVAVPDGSGNVAHLASVAERENILVAVADLVKASLR